MFGCCIAGRPVQTDLQQIDDTHALFELREANNINHICVFLLGTVPFPPGMAATVHFMYPGKGFQLLGGLSPEKPSAIFRLRGPFTPSSASSAVHRAFSSAPSQQSAQQDSITAVLGFSLEPIADVDRQISSLPSKPAIDLTKDPVVLAERVAQNLFNYLSGFIPGGGITPDSMVPMSIVSRWFDSFKTKLQSRGISFLDPQD